MLHQTMTKICQDLPEECWELIVNKLDHYRHFESLSLVSKRFLHLTNRLRLKFTVTHQGIRIHGTISKFLNRFDQVKTLDLSKFKGNLDLVLNDDVFSSVNLEYLDVSNQESLPVLVESMKCLKVFKCANVSRLNDGDLQSISVMMPFLEELDISYPNNTRYYVDLDLDEFTITDVGIEALWSSLTSLRKVDISGCHFISDSSVVGLSMNCLFLSEIVVLDCSFVTHNAFYFVLSNCRHLNVISVNKIQIPASVPATYIRELRCLDLSDDAGISDEFLVSIANACWPLESLSLNWCTDYTFSGISQLLYAYQSLKHLALMNSIFLTDEYVSQLVQYLRHLVSINLSACSHLTTSTFYTLITMCPSLEHIDMGGTSVGMFPLCLPVKNERVKSLNLSSNSYLRDKDLKDITTACPNIELLDIYSMLHITENGIAAVLESCHGIRNLDITDSKGICSLGTGSKLPNLEVLSVTASGFGERGLETISSRCMGLLKLDMEGCVKATTKDVDELLKQCERLREINLKRCDLVKTLNLSSRKVYLKVIPPSTWSFTNYEHFLSHGCLLE